VKRKQNKAGGNRTVGVSGFCIYAIEGKLIFMMNKGVLCSAKPAYTFRKLDHRDLFSLAAYGFWAVYKKLM
jgi:hypothetical protein